MKDLWLHIMNLPLPTELKEHCDLVIKEFPVKEDFYFLKMKTFKNPNSFPNFIFITPSEDTFQLYNYMVLLKQKDWISQKLEDLYYKTNDLTISCYCILYMLSEAYLYTIMPESTIYKYKCIQEEELQKYKSLIKDEVERFIFKKSFPLEEIREEFVWSYFGQLFKRNKTIGMTKLIKKYFEL